VTTSPGVIQGLLERELETAHLQRAVDHSGHGLGRVIVVEGPAGIGKTALVGAARELAREAGMNVRAARGAEFEQSFAFGGVRQLLDPLLASASESQRSEWLSGAAELAAPLFEARAALSALGRDSIYPRLQGLYWLCSNLAREQPLALCLDDAQWADEPSLAFLGFLARRLEELPILLLVAARLPILSAPEGLATLLGDPAARLLRPRGLSVKGVEQMLTRQLGDDVEARFVATCHAVTGGNPFLLHELAVELEAAGIEPLAINAAQIGALGPRCVANAVLARLGQLAPDAGRLAHAVAILGDGASLTDAANLAGIDPHHGSPRRRRHAHRRSARRRGRAGFRAPTDPRRDLSERAHRRTRAASRGSRASAQ